MYTENRPASLSDRDFDGKLTDDQDQCFSTEISGPLVMKSVHTGHLVSGETFLNFTENHESACNGDQFMSHVRDDVVTSTLSQGNAALSSAISAVPQSSDLDSSQMSHDQTDRGQLLARIHLVEIEDLWLTGTLDIYEVRIPCIYHSVLNFVE